MKIDTTGLTTKVHDTNNTAGSLMDQNLKKAPQAFEALFIANIFKSMRKTIPAGGFTKKAPGDEIYKEMFDTEVASHLAKGRGIGLSGMLYNQLKSTFKKDD